jgi:hypothetical protein
MNFHRSYAAFQRHTGRCIAMKGFGMKTLVRGHCTERQWDEGIAVKGTAMKGIEIEGIGMKGITMEGIGMKALQ